MPQPWPLLEQKFYFDELYDARLLQARRRCSRSRSARFVEQPLIAGSISEVTKRLPPRLASSSAALQNGLVRSYALALTSGIAVLAVVFLASTR